MNIKGNSLIQACSIAEELREGFRQLEIRSKETNDKLAAAVASTHYKTADRLIVLLGGKSIN